MTVLATTETGPRETAAGAPLVPMRLCYGVNESDSWWHFALGPNRERLWARLRALDVRIIRMFVFDKHAPDPVLDWPSLRAYIQAALNVGATPFITFAKFRRPFDDPRAVRWFTEQCAEIVWSCAEEWGGETPFWLDWVWRLLNEVDPSLIGFINWHYYAEWRDVAEAGSPPDEGTMQRLIMAQAPEFGLRAQLVGRLLRGRGLPNICGEWNAHSHYLPAVRGRFNQSLFGAAYGAAALVQFLRSGIDAEIVWTGTDDACGYGILSPDAVPTPLYHAKRLCTRHVRYGDGIRFPLGPLHNDLRREWDAVAAYGAGGRTSVFVARLVDRPGTLRIADLEASLTEGSHVIRLDRSTGSQPITLPVGTAGVIELSGYGAAVVTNDPESGPGEERS